MTSFSVAMSSCLHEAAYNHLLGKPAQEELCFALWFPSAGATRTTALMHKLLLPRPNEHELHGNVAFLPSFVERVVLEARTANAGLALMHSHLGPGWQAMSDDDLVAEERLASLALGATGLPIVGLTLATDGAWSGRWWSRVAPRRYERIWCDRVRVVGEYMSVTYHPQHCPAPTLQPQLDRTTSAWGPRVQADLARLRVGVVGTGSVGSIIAEALARMGFTDITLMDFDAIEEVNRDRLLYAKASNVGDAKVRVLADALIDSGTAQHLLVRPLEYSIVEEGGYRAALDCDLLFACVDRPWGRSVLNAIAYAHLVPVVDGGIRAEAIRGGKGLRRVDIRAHVAAPSRSCLECVGQYDSGMVSMERDGYLDTPHYIAGLPDDHPAKHNENVFAFSLQAAGFQLAQMISMIARPMGLGNAGATMYHLVNNSLETSKDQCQPFCGFPGLVALGDRTGMTFTGTHSAALKARAAREALALRRNSKWRRLAAWLKNRPARTRH